MPVGGPGSSDPDANKVVVKQKLVPEEGLAAERESLVGGDQTPQASRQRGASGPQGSSLDDM